jgi:transcriptional regulator with XRE-family HTH domain
MSFRYARQAVGAAIRQRRIELGLSQEALASRASLHRTYVGSVERGERNVSLDNLLRIAKALTTSVSHLVKDCDDDGRK